MAYVTLLIIIVFSSRLREFSTSTIQVSPFTGERNENEIIMVWR